MTYYKVTKAQADTIGEFSYGEINFSPFVREQTDGTYIVASDMYELLKDTDQFKQIDWTKVPTTETFNDKLPEWLKL